MKSKQFIKTLLDVLMCVLMLVLMGYAFLCGKLHEWVGMGMFAAFIVHHVLNAAWHEHLRTGRYTPMRAAMLVVNVLIFVCMIGLMVSGMILSRHVFRWLPPLYGGVAFARVTHLLCSYWGFVLMAIHLGLHWNALWARMTRGHEQHILLTVLTVLMLMLMGYGGYAFVKNEIASYLFLRTQFVYVDYSESVWQFFAEYFAIAACFVWLTDTIVWMLRRKKKTKNST